MNPTISEEARHAKRAANKIWADLLDRRGIKRECASVDPDVVENEIKPAHSKIIETAIDRAAEGLRKDRDDIIAAIEQCFSERPINGMSHAEAIRQVIAERDQLRSENITFAQKACETCDGPTIEEFKRLQTSCAAMTECLKQLRQINASRDGGPIINEGRRDMMCDIINRGLSDTSGSELLERLRKAEKDAADNLRQGLVYWKEKNGMFDETMELGKQLADARGERDDLKEKLRVAEERAAGAGATDEETLTRWDSSINEYVFTPYGDWLLSFPKEAKCRCGCERQCHGHDMGCEHLGRCTSMKHECCQFCPDYVEVLEKECFTPVCIATKDGPKWEILGQFKGKTFCEAMDKYIEHRTKQTQKDEHQGSYLVRISELETERDRLMKITEAFIEEEAAKRATEYRIEAENLRAERDLALQRSNQFDTELSEAMEKLRRAEEEREDANRRACEYSLAMQHDYISSQKRIGGLKASITEKEEEIERLTGLLAKLQAAKSPEG